MLPFKQSPAEVFGFLHAIPRKFHLLLSLGVCASLYAIYIHFLQYHSIIEVENEYLQMASCSYVHHNLLTLHHPSTSYVSNLHMILFRTFQYFSAPFEATCCRIYVVFFKRIPYLTTNSTSICSVTGCRSSSYRSYLFGFHLKL